MKYLLFFLLLTACTTNNIQNDEEFRIDVLYEHTKQMQYFADDELLKQLGLSMEPFNNEPILLTYEKKIEILAESYGTTNKDLDYLEKRMDEMMEQWANIEYEQ